MNQESKNDKYEVNIEGTVHPWADDTITPSEIRKLGDLPLSEPVIEIDLETNVETTLAEDAVVQLKPGQGFARKVEFRRGIE
jgi:hypothetical protein